MKLLLICESYNFETYTRRATFESIAKLHKDSEGLLLSHFSKKKFFNTNSKYLKLRGIVTLIPLRFLVKYKLLMKIEYLINLKKYKKLFADIDIVVYTSPNHVYLRELFKDKKNIFILSDPYHMLEYSFKNTETMIKSADLIFGTAQKLCSDYVQKYYKVNKEVIYWPNCVDPEIWDINKYPPKKNERLVIGFAGNINELIDLKLLNHITDKFKEYQFVFVGKVNYLNSSNKRQIEKIFNKDNVDYKGYINYKYLPLEVSGWDICIMLDDNSELSTYIHHNKIYQYLSLGKPAVILRNIPDYDFMKDVVFISDNAEEFESNIMKALKATEDKQFMEKCITIAKKNSNDDRARQFLEKAKVL